ncbi:hypothetical protein ACG2LH_01640 [Zhouia sp. PK063]|uniref:hypothetical protein n=1 Tax=Zhouia sp. PK063 TaxID=3373602 RepID=UPI00378E7354
MQYLVLIITGILGAIATYIVNENLKQGPVRASALLSLLVASFFYFFPDVCNINLTTHIPVVFIGASFIGMVSARVLSSYVLIGFSGLIFSVIYLNSSHFFEGYGGALGTAACISILVTLSLPVFFKNRKVNNGLMQLRNLFFRRK